MTWYCKYQLPAKDFENMGLFPPSSAICMVSDQGKYFYFSHL